MVPIKEDKPRFTQGTAMDSSGIEIRCKCGKTAGSAIMGKSAYIAHCSDCSPLPKNTFAFVYRPPNYPGPVAIDAKIVEEAWRR